jgi:hypothetical protein
MRKILKSNMTEKEMESYKKRVMDVYNGFTLWWEKHKGKVGNIKDGIRNTDGAIKNTDAK